MATALKLVHPKDNAVLAGLKARARQPYRFFHAMADRPEVLEDSPAFYVNSGLEIPREIRPAN
jgi:hypothetical protein